MLVKRKSQVRQKLNDAFSRPTVVMAWIRLFFQKQAFVLLIRLNRSFAQLKTEI